jgi:very-short-patch-repair endonuclease
MRREQTGPEQRLWLNLRAKRFAGAKFRRQVVIGKFIVDFACRTPKMLVVKVDGETHVLQEAYDAGRTIYLREQGYEVLRFTNAEVTHNLDGVLLVIQQALQLPLSPTLSPEGEREKGAQCRST